MRICLSTQAISIFILLALTSFCANADFTIKKDVVSGTAQINEEELIFDTIELGSYEDYEGKAGANLCRFNLEIGKCKITLIASQVTNLTRITASKGKNVEFIGSDNSSVEANCIAKFESMEDSTYKVDVKLSGEHVPSDLILKSTKASDYEESIREFSVVTSILLGVICFLLIAFLIGYLVAYLVYAKRLTDQMANY